MVDLSIIIVSHNHASFLRPCLESVYCHPFPVATEVFLVDNCSRDGSADLVRQFFPQARLIENTTPQGFAANNNQAIRLSRGRYILLLNPDTEVEPQALERLLGFMEAHPRVGGCGPQLLFPDGSIQPSCRRFPTWWSVLARRSPLRFWLWNSRLNADHLMQDVDHHQLQEVDWLLGACLLLRRESLEEVGLLDEAFFLYVEDIDLCYRMKQKGWKIIYVPQARVIHHHQAESDKRLFSRKTWLHTQSMIHFYRKHYARLPWLALPEGRGAGDPP